MAYRQNRLGVVLETPYTAYLKHYQSQTGGSLGTYGGLRIYRAPNQRGNGLGSIFRSVWKFISPIFGSETVKDLGRKAGERLIDTGAATARKLLENGDVNVADALKMAGKRTLRDIGGDALSAAQAAFDPRPQEGSGIKRRRKQVCFLLNKTGKIGATRKRRRRKRKSPCGGKTKRKSRRKPGAKKVKKTRKRRKRKSVGKRRVKAGGKKRKSAKKKRKRSSKSKGRKRSRKSKFPIFL